MARYQELQDTLQRDPQCWLVTGAAGFIGSHLVESLLGLGQTVIGLDNFITGYHENLESVKGAVGDGRWANFRFVEGSITDPAACAEACRGADFVLHQAALGSVPLSLENPVASHETNVTGMLHMLLAARHTRVKRFVYASSCAVYGDSPVMPKVEKEALSPLSPYAATKWIDEIYAHVFARTHAPDSIGLRYFNIFGPRQDPAGAYAAVIPKWIRAMLRGEPVRIHGTGETSRDFCHVADVVQANLLAATTVNETAINDVFNVALHKQTSLSELFAMIREALQSRDPSLEIVGPERGEFREGDVMHSLADIKKARSLLGFEPVFTVAEGLDQTVAWFRDALLSRASHRRAP